MQTLKNQAAKTSGVDPTASAATPANARLARTAMVLGAVIAAMFFLSPQAHAASAEDQNFNRETVVSPLASCGDSQRVTVWAGGRVAGNASWTVSCSGRTVTVKGSVTDSRADGYCVYVYGNIGSKSVSSSYACPDGDKETFNWSGTGTAYIYAAATYVG